MRTLRNPLLWLALGALALAGVLAAHGQTAAPAVVSLPASDFQPLLDLLSGQFGWLATFVVWIGALRIPMKLLSGWLQATLTAFVARVNQSPETDDDAQLDRLFHSLTYRFIAFTLDAVLSLKLPTSETLAAHQHNAVPLTHV